MKAICIHEHGGPEVLRYEDVPRPEPGIGEVLIKVETIGVNYPDIMQCQGSYIRDFQLPLILGMEVVGTLVQAGPGVSTYPLGTRVVALELIRGGAYAECAVMKASHIFPVPAQLDSIQASAFLLPGLTAYQSLHDAGRLQPNESVLIQAAAGGVGSLAIQLARLQGASKVIGMASNAAKLDLVRSLGGDVAINYTEDNWVEQVKHATDGRGVNLVLDMMGGEMVQKNLECLTLFGRIVFFGAVSGKSGQIVGLQLTRKCLSAIGYWLPVWMNRPERIQAAVTALTDYLVQGRLQPVIHSVLPLAEAATAHRMILERKVAGKVILVV